LANYGPTYPYCFAFFPELRTLVADLALATNRVTKTDDGERLEEVTCVDVAVW